MVGVDPRFADSFVSQPEYFYDPGEEADLAASKPSAVYRLGQDRTFRLYGDRGPGELLQALGVESLQELETQHNEALDDGMFEKAGVLAAAMSIITENRQSITQGVDSDDAADTVERIAVDMGLPAGTTLQEINARLGSRGRDTDRQADLDELIESAYSDLQEVGFGMGGRAVAGYQQLPEYQRYDRLRTLADGPDWRRQDAADAAQRSLDETRLWTVELGGVWDAVKSPFTGEHRSQWDSEIPFNIDVGLLPFAGTAIDLGVRGRDGYSAGDVALLAGMGALDVVPLPAGKGVLQVIRHPLDATNIVTGGRRSLQSVTQGPLKIPYDVPGSRIKEQGVPNIPVRLGDNVIVDGQVLPAWEGLLLQRDRALAGYRATGEPQYITLPTADGGTQTIAVAGSRAATSYGTGGMVHTSPFAGEMTRQSQELAEGLMGRVKTNKAGELLPPVEQQHFLTTRGTPAFLEGSAFIKQLTPEQQEIFSPGYQALTTPENLADIDDIRKVFGGDVETAQMHPTAVVELEAGVPQPVPIAGGAKPALFRERPVGLGERRGGHQTYFEVDRPPSMQAGRWQVFKDNVLAAVDNARGRRDVFYVVQEGPDGTRQAFRAGDLQALADEGLTPDKALRITTRTGEVRLVSPRTWEAFGGRGAVRSVVRGADGRRYVDRLPEGVDSRGAGHVDVRGRGDGQGRIDSAGRVAEAGGVEGVSRVGEASRVDDEGRVGGAGRVTDPARVDDAGRVGGAGRVTDPARVEGVDRVIEPGVGPVGGPVGDVDPVVGPVGGDQAITGGGDRITTSTGGGGDRIITSGGGGDRIITSGGGGSRSGRRRRDIDDAIQEAAEREGTEGHPRSVEFITQEKVRVDLLTGEETRTPVDDDMPAETLAITEYGPAPIIDQRLAGRITDVATDGAGRPFVAVDDQHQTVRPPRASGEGPAETWPDTPPPSWPKSAAWPPQTELRRQLARSLIQSQAEATVSEATGSGGQAKSRSKSYKPQMSKVLKAAQGTASGGSSGGGRGSMLGGVRRRRGGSL